MPQSEEKKYIRLTQKEIQEIISATQEVAEKLNLTLENISLFGSRTDPKAKGGDIDLYFKILKSLDNDYLFYFKRSLLLELHHRLGEQKIDLVVDDGASDLGAFWDIIKNKKVTLWKKN